jgi:hypothetical protein
VRCSSRQFKEGNYVSDSPPHLCPRLEAALADEDTPIEYVDRFREYSISVLDGGSSGLLLDYCPFCGQRLPGSLRNAWFDRLEEQGLEPEDELPAEMQSGRWWRRSI